MSKSVYLTIGGATPSGMNEGMGREISPAQRKLREMVKGLQ